MGILTVVFLFQVLTVLPMKKNCEYTEKLIDPVVHRLILEYMNYVTRPLFELSPTPAVLSKGPVEQELMDVVDLSNAFRQFKISQRIDHLAGVFERLNECNKLKESKTIVPPSYSVQRLRWATSALEKDLNDRELKTSVDAFIQKVTAFYFKLSELKPREKMAQDLQIYDSFFNPFPIACGDIPEDLLIKSGYVKDQLNYLVDLLKKFHEENNRKTCKKVVSPLHLALVIKGAERLIKAREDLHKNLGDVVSLDKLINCAKENVEQVDSETSREHVKGVMLGCSLFHSAEESKDVEAELMELTIEQKEGGKEIFFSYVCEKCKDRTVRLISQYNTLSREVEKFNAELGK